MNRTSLSSAELAERARETLLVFLYPKDERQMTPDQHSEFELAVGEQTAFLASPEGRAASCAAEGIAGESVGDVSVTFSKNGGRRAAGLPVSPLAEARLLRCGLLGRWV